MAWLLIRVVSLTIGMMLKDVIVSFHLILSHMWITDLGLYLVSTSEAFDLSFIKHAFVKSVMQFT